MRPSSPQPVAGMFLTTHTSDGSHDTSGTAAQLTYAYETRRFQTTVQAEHYDRDFQMDAAFYLRTGFTSAWAHNQANFYPGGGKTFWLQQISPFVFAKAGRDRIQGGDEWFLNTGVRFNFTRQGNFEIATSPGKEAWRGEEFNAGSDIFMFANMQVVRWLGLFGGGVVGPGIYYDDVDPFQGRSLFSFFGGLRCSLTSTSRRASKATYSKCYPAPTERRPGAQLTRPRPECCNRLASIGE